ncbi:hypothetical protein [Stenotrophomonas indicatrix]|uniref:hypothetical protein n=1 Tax=Stenotrophomonas indicatrix TaxID=2045451 RepID=UPI001AA0CD1A|nr:hypothetical protein [Stenotrophomonas indicatrix]MBO1748906.1 hypothetical protein [Stenotrophomonas indicatrix]
MSDTTSFDKAIAVLLNAAENAENNAPIWDNENNPDQADLCWLVAESCRNAASVLAAGVEV